MLKSPALINGILSILFLFPFLTLPNVTCGINFLSLSNPCFLTTFSITSVNLYEFPSFSESSRKITFGNFWFGKKLIPLVSKIILLKPKSFPWSSSIKVCAVFSLMLPRNLKVRWNLEGSSHLISCSLSSDFSLSWMPEIFSINELSSILSEKNVLMAECKD